MAGSRIEDLGSRIELRTEQRVFLATQSSFLAPVV